MPSAAAIYALIGPTGVGKTTTVASAARCALTYGAQSVALLTADSYRIGAHGQLASMVAFSVPVHDVKDETDLRTEGAAAICPTAT